MKRCFNCGKDTGVEGRPGRGEACLKCGADVKVCLNCKFYDQHIYNECREPSADRVLEKNRSNYCDYFDWRTGGEFGGLPEDPLKSLKDLFKK